MRCPAKSSTVMIFRDGSTAADGSSFCCSSSLMRWLRASWTSGSSRSFRMLSMISRPCLPRQTRWISIAAAVSSSLVELWLLVAELEAASLLVCGAGLAEALGSAGPAWSSDDPVDGPAAPASSAAGA